MYELGGLSTEKFSIDVNLLVDVHVQVELMTEDPKQPHSVHTDIRTHSTSSQPLTFKHASCAGSKVPPPMVPTSMDGIVQEMRRSLLSIPQASIIVRQLELPTF